MIPLMGDLRQELRNERFTQEMVYERLRVSEFCQTAVYDDNPVAMVGFMREHLLSNRAFGWMLVTNRALTIGLPLVKLSRGYMKRLHGTTLDEVWTMVRFEAGVQWMKWLGFKVVQETPPFTWLEWRK